MGAWARLSRDPGPRKASSIKPRPISLRIGQRQHAFFLRWLVPRHEKLHALVARDLEQRQLDPARSGVAVATLANRDHLLRRHIDLVMVSKGLYLWYAAQKEPYIMMQSAFSDVLNRPAM